MQSAHGRLYSLNSHNCLLLRDVNVPKWEPIIRAVAWRRWRDRIAVYCTKPQNVASRSEYDQNIGPNPIPSAFIYGRIFL